MCRRKAWGIVGTPPCICIVSKEPCIQSHQARKVCCYRVFPAALTNVTFRHSDFLSGLPTTPVGPGDESMELSPADRLRLIHAYITCIPADGGLGITPGSSDWDLVESIMALHDRSFNETWIRSWTPRQIASVQLEKIREQVCSSFKFVEAPQYRYSS